MKVKKYVVKDVREAMRMIKEELGDDAVILNTRKIKKGGFFGLGAKTYFEVTAVVEDENKNKKVEKPKAVSREDIYKLQEILMKNRMSRKMQSQPSSVSPPPMIAPPSRSVEEELMKIKDMISELKSMVVSGKNEVPPGIRTVVNGMRRQEIDNDVITKVTEYLRITYGDVDPEAKEFKYKLAEYLVPFIKTEEANLSGKILFVGPTGVGKTTTLAKIAAKLKLELKKNVAILTFDTYRIAAADQLKTYASIMDIPIRVAYTPQEASMALNAMIDYETILMDTAGRSQKNDIQMGELKVIVDMVKPDKIFLVLGMNYRLLDVKEIIRKFKMVNPTHVILTKMDETSSYGHFINVPLHSDLPIIYVTNGQRVPEDIFEANSVELSKILANGVLENV